MPPILRILGCALVLACGACVKGPLVDFGDRDKPFVDIKIGAPQDDDPNAKEKKDTGKKPPTRTDSAK